jgi:large subunit ribosomal protein L24
MKTKLRKSDEVLVVTGKEKGKRGKLLRINRDKNTVLIEGINLVKKTLRKSQKNPQGGIVEVEAPVHISNVVAGDKQGQRTRLGFRVGDSGKSRIARKTGEEL